MDRGSRGEWKVTDDSDASFSRRHGYGPPDREITVREDAPDDLRIAILMIARDVGLTPKALRDVVCGTLLVAPDTSNWSTANVWGEVNYLVQDCEWFRVYEIAEAIYRRLNPPQPEQAHIFQDRLNNFFRERGIGWQMAEGQIVVRGSESFTAATREAPATLEEHGRSTAAREIHQALADLSRRPDPDITGAIQHAMAALECVARDVAGDGSTLGEVINRHASALGVRPPLDQALGKLWGYTSQEGRHVREGRDPSFEEAELVVTLAAAVSVYVSKKAAGQD